VWTTALLVLGPTILFVGLVVVIHDYLAPEGGWLRQMEDAGEIFSTVGTGLAVLVAFLIVAAFGHYQNARDAVGKEAVAVQQQYVMASYFDQADSDQLRGEVLCYARAVVDDEWPAMQRNDESARVQGWVDAMDTSMRASTVDTQKQVEALAHWFDVSNDRQDGRRERLAESKPFVPGFLWAALILISLVVLGYQLLMIDPSVKVFGQAYSMAAMAITVFAALAVVFMLDRPFNARGAEISHIPMDHAIALMSRTAPPTLPCTADGTPTRA
jgi:hypothetical protein